MNRGFFLAGILCLVALAPLSPAGTPKVNLDGVWVPESATVDGRKLTMKELDKIKVTVKGRNYTVQKDDKVLHTGVYTMDNTKNPKWLDAVSETPNGGKKKVYGIYKLEGDTLTVCGVMEGKNRPTDFTAPKDSDRELVVYRRQK